VKTDPQIDVAHFIQSVTLKGTREQKLRCLDLLIEHLQQVRRSLAEEYFAAVGEIPPMDAIGRAREMARCPRGRVDAKPPPDAESLWALYCVFRASL